MSTQSQDYKLQLQVYGQAEMTRLTAELSRNEAELKQLTAAYQAGSISLDDYSQKAGAAVGNVNRLNREMDSLGGTGRNTGRAILEGSRALEDLQYGIAGVLNNLPGLVAALGGGAGLAGIISLVAVGSVVLYRNWDNLMSVFGQGKIKTEAEEMKELADNTKRTADEEERYQKLKERAKHAEAQGEKPEAKTEFGKHVDKTIAEGPLEDIQKGIDKHFGDRIRTMAELDPRHAAATQTLKDFAELKGDETTTTDPKRRMSPDAVARHERRRAEAQETLNSTYGDARKAFLNDLPNKPDTVKKLQEAAEKNPGDFGKNGAKFARDLALTPEQVEKDRKFAEEDDAAIQAEEDRRKLNKELKAIKKKADDKRLKEEKDALEKEAKVNADAWAAEVSEAKKSKTYLEKTDAQRTNAEKVAAKDDADADAAKLRVKTAFNKKVDESRASKDYANVEDRDRTAEQKEAHALDKKDFDEAKRKRLEGKADQGDAVDKQMDLLREKKAKSSETLEGGASFAAKIQAGVSNDNVQKEQLKELKAIKDAITKQQQNIQRAQFGK